VLACTFGSSHLVRLKPDVIVTGGNPSIAALKQATTTVPIVMVWAVDPVGAGLVTSLARPGGNIMGASPSTGPEFIAKQLDMLNEVVPKPRVGFRAATYERTPIVTTMARSMALY
jgi:putative ABC transport system substrate-binding protein